jgi:hypothetical protein
MNDDLVLWLFTDCKIRESKQERLRVVFKFFPAWARLVQNFAVLFTFYLSNA